LNFKTLWLGAKSLLATNNIPLTIHVLAQPIPIVTNKHTYTSPPKSEWKGITIANIQITQTFEVFYSGCFFVLDPSHLRFVCTAHLFQFKMSQRSKYLNGLSVLLCFFPESLGFLPSSWGESHGHFVPLCFQS